MKYTTYNGDIYMVCKKCKCMIRWLDRTEDGICKKCKEKGALKGREKVIYDEK